ncbi:zinc finger protein 184-like [Uranotaenia lowii]|uniref:zinc finger protein 184-like n=1 Tax=Uranotaenia lowii TaxID=190385 RepID=UPI00247A2167|nr:zinc finger protein 184-like [Uranotaenia lowii]XP_055606177.1 zinc finger protein 184-like [Uranotaenia lowii]
MEPDVELQALQTACRLCLRRVPVVREFFSEPRVAESFFQVFKFSLSQNGQLSTKICEPCCGNIILWNDYSKMVVRNQAHLNSLLVRSEKEKQWIEIEEIVQPKLEPNNDVPTEESLPIGDNQMIAENGLNGNEPCTSSSNQQVPMVVENCSKDSTSSSNHLNSLQLVPGSIQPYSHRCEKCDKSFSLKVFLEKHKQKHSLPNPADIRKQNGTSKKFHMPVSLFEELRKLKASPQVEEHPCDYCGVSFRLGAALNKHRLRHLEQQNQMPVEKQNIRCFLCHKQFESLSKLYSHVSSAHNHLKQRNDEKVQCQVCRQWYKNASSLSHHMQNFHDVRGFDCSGCNMSFAILDDLTTHRRDVHQNQFGYTCPKCREVFLSSKTFRRHLQRSHGQRVMYRCEQCGEEFFYEASYRKHQQEMHPKPVVHPIPEEHRKQEVQPKNENHCANGAAADEDDEFGLEVMYEKHL